LKKHDKGMILKKKSNNGVVKGCKQLAKVSTWNADICENSRVKRGGGVRALHHRMPPVRAMKMPEKLGSIVGRRWQKRDHEMGGVLSAGSRRGKKIEGKEG